MTADHSSIDRPITCVMPAFNEEGLIEESVHGLLDFWREHTDRFTLIVVDDGSTDRTAEVLSAVALTDPSLRVVSYRPNRGKGAAVRAGTEAAPDSGVLYYVDADLPFSHEDQLRVVSAVSAATPAVYGSRILDQGVQGASVLRRIASRALAFLNRMILGITVADNQCGLKAFDAVLAGKVFPLNDIDGFGFDLFTSAYLGKHEIDILPVPVHLLPERRPSTVGVVRVSLQMLRQLFAVRRKVRRLPIDPDLRQA